jgi:elongation factor P
MATTTYITPGLTISVDGQLYRVESSVKVSAPKGAPFIKTKLREISTHKIIEKNFKEGQAVETVSLTERSLEYLYMEGQNYLFLDVGQFDQILVSPTVIGDKLNYLKEGVEIKGFFYGDTIFSVELPNFLELMVAKIQSDDEAILTSSTKTAILETGASIEVPSFVEVGDIIKIDTKTNEYIQRV